ncbi:hypothetical protein [Acidithiobacillus sulfuriphilus]|jgi:hypothetical protein|uniref:Uncharacterized protein n=1 Tax=Acidithiobacillus sulfuriphilus TaxID=1867749 RepID=A0ACD5HJW8_9PROT|nr:hypothetical protein [Acidithiobacillus sulfuriphilus]
MSTVIDERRKNKKHRHYDAEFGVDGWWNRDGARAPREVAIPPFPSAVGHEP